ncbi:MAG: AMIN domain-containing protein, partial [Candidatus Gastranaerophilales bacterium]|nr:AMIN domain-containing protein [Candidatus Gastranaerophilales bacterium]
MKRRDLGITGFNIAVFVLLLLSFFFVPTERCFAADGDLIIKYATPDKAGKLLIIGGDISGRNVAPPPQIKYKVTKLDNPPRMVVDIKNAVLSGGKKSIRLNNSKLTQDIRIAQFESNPNIVRIVFT